MSDGESWTTHDTGVILALPGLAGFTSTWRSTSYAPDQPDLPVERRFPPHVTVLTPFAEADDETALKQLRQVAASHHPLDLSFGRAEQFGPGGAVWLVPEPADPVLALLLDVAAAFPDHPPYGGLHPKVVPHLTVTTDGDDATLAQVRSALADQGPLTARVDELGVWQRGLDEVWRLVAAFPLGQGCS